MDGNLWSLIIFRERLKKYCQRNEDEYKDEDENKDKDEDEDKDKNSDKNKDTDTDEVTDEDEDKDENKDEDEDKDKNKNKNYDKNDDYYLAQSWHSINNKEFKLIINVIYNNNFDEDWKNKIESAKKVIQIAAPGIEFSNNN